MQSLPSVDIDDLFRRAMIGLDDDDLGSIDDPTGWIAIGRLQRMANRAVLEMALTFCVDTDPLKRRVGAHVLAQLGHSKPGFEPVFVEERLAGLIGLLEAERDGRRDPGVLAAVCTAFGHLPDIRAIPSLLALMSHRDPNVRSGVVHGLSGHEDDAAIEGLIALSEDPADRVRDWATFELGQVIEMDTPTIRAALHARLDDACHDVRNEAIEGLARRGDRSVLPFLIRELEAGVALPLLDAATMLATPELCEALAATQKGGLVIGAKHGP
ncbi:HEAT repeat protein [Enterovirga rhinocerotis]|uniref:HEAT repeat protein n=1 Tax=Enterovirga rhinocerotis TaxID=1339210 RepID=A0A4R7BSW4_9HYPH|nr:HEAT repeat protein [Enterovirga rhinocerotis]